MRWKEFISEELGISQKLLPNGYQKIGDIIILNLPKELWKYKEEIGKKTLEFLPKFKTVCLNKGRIREEFRVPNIEVIAGDGTETVHKENGCLFKLDVSKVMFCKGNIKERIRMKEVTRGVVLDMFAGIGYFSIPAGKNEKVKSVYAIEKNPVAFHYLKENIKLNGLNSKVIPFLGDAREVIEKEKFQVDEVIMGLLPNPKHCFKHALMTLEEGKIYYHTVYDMDKGYDSIVEELKELGREVGKCIKVEKITKIKRFGPRVNHIVLDLSAFP